MGGKCAARSQPPVGPQAPCWSGGGVKINGGKAAAEGKAAGADAVNQARSFAI